MKYHTRYSWKLKYPLKNFHVRNLKLVFKQLHTTDELFLRFHEDRMTIRLQSWFLFPLSSVIHTVLANPLAKEIFLNLVSEIVSQLLIIQSVDTRLSLAFMKH